MEKKSVRVNFAYQLLNKGLTILIPLILTPYVTRVLSADALGVYTYSNTVASYFVTFILMGIAMYGSKVISSHQESSEALERQYSTLVTAQLLNSVLAVVAYLVYMQWLPIENRAIFWIQLLYVLSATVDLSWFFAGVENFKGMSIRNMVVNVASCVLIILFVHSESDLWVYTLIKAGSTLLSQLALVVPVLRRYRYQVPTLRELWDVYKGLLVLFIPVLADTIFQTMDKVMLAAQYSYAAVGIYYSSRMVTDIPQTVITSLNTILFPRITSMVAKDQQHAAMSLFQTASSWMMVVCIAMAFGIRAIAVDFVALFFGPSYSAVATVLPVLVAYICLAAWTGILRYQYLLPHSLERYYVSAIVVGIVVNLVLNAWLIPIMGVMGAVVATLAAEATIAVIEMVPVWRQFEWRTWLGPVMVAAVSGWMMELAVGLVRQSVLGGMSLFMAVVVEILVGIIVFSALMSVYVFGFNREILQQLRRSSND